MKFDMGTLKGGLNALLSFDAEGTLEDMKGAAEDLVKGVAGDVMSALSGLSEGLDPSSVMEGASGLGDTLFGDGGEEEEKEGEEEVH